MEFIDQSMDNGLTWNRISQGLDGYFVNDLIINGDYIYAGVNGGAVWKRPLSEITSVSEMKKNELPSDFALSQNYPNPFNPSTTIGYSLPKSSFVTVKVFDILGREVTELVNEEKGAGKYSIHFDGSNLSGGIYFYSIKAGNYRKVKKMILIK